MKQEMMTIIEQQQLADTIYQMTLTGQLVQKMAKPGQFIYIKVPRQDLLLRRPISLNQINQRDNTCTIIYRAIGEGTRFFTHMQAGEQLDVIGPLGNGFDIHCLAKGQTAFIIGGGIGVAPLYELSKQLTQRGINVIHFLGFMTQAMAYYQDNFMALGQTWLATDDGSLGIKGSVIDLLEQTLTIEKGDAIYACGANGLLKKVAQRFIDHPNVFLSLEQRMACGIGACYACVCQGKSEDQRPIQIKICEQGPVVRASEVTL